jgi:hypothetical protein
VGHQIQRRTARLQVIVKNQPGALAAVANIFGVNKANILNLQLVNREGPFHTDIIDLEVADAQHLMRILSALRALDFVAQADRGLALADSATGAAGWRNTGRARDSGRRDLRARSLCADPDLL